MVTREFVVSATDAGARLDQFLAKQPGVGSRSRAAGLIEQGAVLVAGECRPKRYLVSTGQVVTVALDEMAAPALRAEDHDVNIPFEDEYLLVVDKPAGMTVHPSRGHSRGTLVHALLGHGIAGGEDFRPGVVHRLDKDTSGLLVVAKTPEVHRRLVKMLGEHALERNYLALVHGSFSADTGTIEAPVGRDPVRRQSMAIGGRGARDARTHFEVLERFPGFTLVRVRLETGRTHQIRVHFLGIGHPVAGDPTYGRRDPLGIGRQFLHSARLRLEHPVTEELLDIESPLPEDLGKVVALLREEVEVASRR